MTNFLVTGEGFPLFKVLEHLTRMPSAHIVGVIPQETGAIKAEAFASEKCLPVYPRQTLTKDGIFPESASADWLVNINGTTIIAPDVINRFPQRALNMHPGLLPAYAGLHCHQWAIRNGEKYHGATIHIMDEGVDTGPMIAQTTLDIYARDTGLSLFRRTMAAGTDLMIKVLECISAGDPPKTSPQDLSQRHLYKHNDALDGRIDWCWDARRIVDFVRAANYEPLKCPTYTPTATFSGMNFVVRSCESFNSIEKSRPGHLIKLVENGPVTACGKGEAVVITRALHDGSVTSLEKWREIMVRSDGYSSDPTC